MKAATLIVAFTAVQSSTDNSLVTACKQNSFCIFVYHLNMQTDTFKSATLISTEEHKNCKAVEKSFGAQASKDEISHLKEKS